MFSATDEFTSTAETTITAVTTDVGGTSNSAEPFDLCQLPPILQLFLCDQAAKYQGLSYRLNFADYTYEKCTAKWYRHPKFFIFRCPPIIDLNLAGEYANLPVFYIHLSGSDRPGMALVFISYLRNTLAINVTAWMESIDFDILKKVEEEPGKFGLGDVEALILES